MEEERRAAIVGQRRKAASHPHPCPLDIWHVRPTRMRRHARGRGARASAVGIRAKARLSTLCASSWESCIAPATAVPRIEGSSGEIGDHVVSWARGRSGSESGSLQVANECSAGQQSRSGLVELGRPLVSMRRSIREPRRTRSASFLVTPSSLSLSSSRIRPSLWSRIWSQKSLFLKPGECSDSLNERRNLSGLA